MGGEISEGGGVSASQQTTASATAENRTVTPQTPETTKPTLEISKEAPLATGENATGTQPADIIKDFATAGGGIENTFKNISEGKVIEDKIQTPSNKDAEAFKKYQEFRTEKPDDEQPGEASKNSTPDENKAQTPTKNEAAFANYRDMMRTETPQDTEPTKPPSAIPEADTKTNQPTTENNQTKTGDPTSSDAGQKTEEDYSFKTPGNIDNDIQNQKDEKESSNVNKGDEKTDDSAKSQEAKQAEQNKQRAEIADQLKNLNLDPDSDEYKNFLKLTTENPEQMKTTQEFLNLLTENKKSLESSNALKGLGIDISELTKASNKALVENLVKQLEDKVAKSKQESVINPYPNKQKESEEDSMLIKILKALGILLVSGTLGALKSTSEEAIKIPKPQ